MGELEGGGWVGKSWVGWKEVGWLERDGWIEGLDGLKRVGLSRRGEIGLEWNEFGVE